jgi:ribosomal protein S18 acetylase RimI-like enzyme
MHDALINPMWASLTSTHAGFALASGGLRRFQGDVAPFCAVAQAGTPLDDTSCVQPGETVFFLGTFPALPDGWTVQGEFAILQMVAAGAQPAAADGDAQTLGPADLPAMRNLTALVYPEFFRPRTAALGTYIGCYEQGRLIAMAGQRLACPGYREISAVCTHPDHRGQGHAGRLIGQLARAMVAKGEVPFLHVSAANERAWKLYENLGFVACRELPFIKVRAGAAP